MLAVGLAAALRVFLVFLVALLVFLVLFLDLNGGNLGGAIRGDTGSKIKICSVLVIRAF